jgi:cold shock CspA family protein
MVVGQVKWFNAKAGFGFVTVGSEDVFVHHSEIQVGKEQFRYLVEGEYVELTVTKKAGEEKRQGSGITGIGGGKVMCEVRSAASEATSEYKAGREPEVREARPRAGASGAGASGAGSSGAGSSGAGSSGAGSRPRTSVAVIGAVTGAGEERKKRVGGVKKSTSVVQQMTHKPEAELE